MNASVFDIFNIMEAITWNDEMPHINPVLSNKSAKPWTSGRIISYKRSEPLRNLTKPWQPQFSARGAATSVIRFVPYLMVRDLTCPHTEQSIVESQERGRAGSVHGIAGTCRQWGKWISTYNIVEYISMELYGFIVFSCHAIYLAWRGDSYSKSISKKDTRHYREIYIWLRKCLPSPYR